VNPAVYGLLAMLCVALAMFAIPRIRAQEVSAIDGPADLGDPEDKSLLRKLFRNLTRRLGPVVLQTRGTVSLDKLDERLDYAGRPGNMTVEGFLGRQAAATVFGGALGLFLILLGATWLSILFGLVFPYLGWEIWLRRTGRLRQERIERDLPDFLDILSVTVRAGLGYRAALTRVSEQLGGPVADEMMIALRQMGLGVVRREAFEGLRARSSSDSMASFVAAQLQAEELGVPLADALNDIAEDMRRRSHQNARRHAQRAAPRVSLVTTMLIVPGAIILLLVSLALGTDLQDSPIF
jgi:tight adherence protein C